MRLFVISVLLVFGFPFIMTKVVDSFGECSQFFLDQQPPEIPGILVTGASKNGNRYKKICQLYNNAYRFATLYDTGNKIPVFSAYKYTKRTAVFDRPKNNFRQEDGLDKEKQAKDGDYKNNNMEMSRGHLFPSSHAADLETAKSTFTLTNVVPQEEHFNNGKWNQKELDFKKYMDENCLDNNNRVEAYVLTGAVPGKGILNGVNIPSHMWMAFCCYDKNSQSWHAMAYCATNEKDSKAVLTEERLADLHDFLKTWVKDVKLFPDKVKKEKFCI